MKIKNWLRYFFALLVFTASGALHAELKEGESLLPELGLYIDINEEEWGAAKVNLRLVDNNFQLYFLDGNDLLVAPKVKDVIIHYGNFIKDSTMKNTIVLEQQGLVLTNGRVITPPSRYMVRIFLRKMVKPNYYTPEQEVKEFIGLHTLNQLGSEFQEASKTQPYSEPVPTGAQGEAPKAEQGMPSTSETAIVTQEEQDVEDAGNQMEITILPAEDEK